MQDIEIQSLLEEAGYRYAAEIGRYVETASEEEGSQGQVDYATEDMADQLEIPIEDLIRWEQEQLMPEE